MKLLIMTAFHREAAVFLQRLTELAPLTAVEVPGMASCLHARLATGEIYYAATGLGTEEAAIATTALLPKLTPDAVIMAGTAGGAHPDYRQGDLVLGGEVLQLDLLSIHALLENTPFADCLENPNSHGKLEIRWPSEAKLLQAALRTGMPRLHSGKIFSSNSFPAPAQSFASIAQLGGGAIEMESAGVFRAANRFGPTPALAVRAISNLLDERGRDLGTGEHGVEDCAGRLADFLMALIGQLHQVR